MANPWSRRPPSWATAERAEAVIPHTRALSPRRVAAIKIRKTQSILSGTSAAQGVARRAMLSVGLEG